MKVWYGYGSEHSMKLVMIGRFKNVGEAAKTKEVIDQLTEQVRADVDANLMMEIGERTDRFTDGMLKLLQNVRLHVLAPAELEQFAYEVSVQLKDNEIVVTTDEVDVSAFLKVLLNEGAKIEVYSAHRYPDTGYGP